MRGLHSVPDCQARWWRGGEEEDVRGLGPARPVPGLDDHLVAGPLLQAVQAELEPVGDEGGPADLHTGDDHVGPVSSPLLHTTDDVREK